MSGSGDRPYPDQLPVGYYLKNFERILDFVENRYGDILSSEEKRFSKRFHALSLDARRLYVRLISRRGPFFRSDTLRYPEIGGIEAAAEQLAAAGFLEIDGCCDLLELLVLLRKAEIITLIDVCTPRDGETPPASALKALRKQQLIEQTVALAEHMDIRPHLRTLFHLYRPLQEQSIAIYRLLFLGNLYQDLTEFVVTDLGHVRYESYSISRKERQFATRESLERSLRLIELNDAFHMEVEGRSAPEIDTNTLLSLLEYLPERDAVAEDPHVRRMRDNLINGIARHLERIGADEQALHLYRLAELPPSRDGISYSYPCPVPSSTATSEGPWICFDPSSAAGVPVASSRGSSISRTVPPGKARSSTGTNASTESPTSWCSGSSCPVICWNAACAAFPAPT